MEYYVEKEKAIFSYTTSDGISHTDMSDDYLDSLELSDESKAKLIKDHVRFSNQLEYFERKWRNKILSLTDWLMVEDATFKDVEVRESEMFNDIKTYRKALRNYKPREEDRPTRPDWLII